jgi:hypothetical protein
MFEKFRLRSKSPVAMAESELRHGVDGLTLGGAFVPWARVVSVHALKEDLFAFDRICLMIGLDDGTAVAVSEDLEEWKEFVDALPDYLPGCLPFHKWFFAVAFPAFEMNLTELYRREV